MLQMVVCSNSCKTLHDSKIQDYFPVNNIILVDPCLA